MLSGKPGKLTVVKKGKQVSLKSSVGTTAKVGADCLQSP